ncbi:MAG: 3-deoxy-7-phosphoheptulonate synthase [Acidobacteria bacterium RIFCSPLOWO2_02_FULL_68_18]|nr:MAG: 3-deoxy-7-phosphoheptulonate synthase [Acidobacteria bacterium RIFCSPLOWO2_02_FULL_68_18]OFW48304.1 MAG: 3-deoxy-7-phosphoheptulonate synthase [Acidobacteria bacterium RIFCSPLOWO2_12_FULL_68_19]
MKDISDSDLRTNIPLASARPDGRCTPVRVGNVEVGGNAVVVIAGPCAVENDIQVLDIARAVKAAGAAMLRGGAFKPLTFPYRNERMYELGEVGLQYLRAAGDATGLPIVTEVVDVRLVDMVGRYADVVQVGARNMQNVPLLEEVGRVGKPVLLKRHFGASLRDWLGAAEYILHRGNERVILCERGIVAPHTHAPTSRFIVDIQAIPAVREYSHLPVLVDPSHSTFRRRYVAPIARAAIAAGADGLILDVHPDPERAAVDPLQALDYAAFGELMRELRGISSVMGRKL